MSRTSSPKPEVVIELAGALVDWSPEKSSRKNVFRVTNNVGQQILLQDDCSLTCKEWFDAIKSTILKLPSKFDTIQSIKSCSNQRNNDLNKSGESINSAATFNTSSDSVCKDKDQVTSFKASASGLKRSKSQKQTKSENICQQNSENSHQILSSKTKCATLTIASVPNYDSNQLPEKKKKIRERLLLFLRRRPTIESLREKGIFKDEPVFGCNLLNLCSREKSNVPKIVKIIIDKIEDKFLSSDGLYRVCGNLSTVTKLRFEVNQDNNYDNIDTECNVHVLTGLLKMFFRDMKEPLLPCPSFEPLMAAMGEKEFQHKLNGIKDELHQLPKPHFETLKYLLSHLLNVESRSEENRMHIQNLAIVFGPTLIWPASENRSRNDQHSKDGPHGHGHKDSDSNKKDGSKDKDHHHNVNSVNGSNNLASNGSNNNTFAMDMLMKLKSNQLIEFLLINFHKIFTNNQ